MNLPNKLTVFRVLCVPFFVFFLMMEQTMAWSFGAIGICVVFYFTLLWLIAREDVRAMLHLVKKK